MYHHASHPMGISKVASFVVVPPPPRFIGGYQRPPRETVTWEKYGNWNAFQWFGPRLHANSLISVFRYWRPGPQDSFFKQRYFNFGFLYLQDLIDRALMNILLNETIEEPGVYMQEFPYPCYVKDK